MIKYLFKKDSWGDTRLERFMTSFVMWTLQIFLFFYVLLAILVVINEVVKGVTQ